MEIDNGWYGGNTVDEVKAIDEENYRQWIESPGLCRPGGGENLDELAKRVTSGVLSIVEAWCGEPTLVVTHGGPIRVLKGDRLDFSDFHKIEVENLGVYSVQKGHEDAIALKREFIS